MPSDLPSTPNGEDFDVISKVFAETRASTLVSQTSNAAKPAINATENVNADASAAQPQVSGEVIVAPASQTGEARVDADAGSVGAPIIEGGALVSDSVTAPAENLALSVSFAPAPDAPFQSSVTVGIACQLAGAAIFYTLDGTAPDSTSMRYSPEKILLTQSATLSARAFVGEKFGPICSAGYVVAKPMWQENEPADQTDATPHKESDNLAAPDNWQLSAASVRGKLHAHRALWREDSFALGTAENAAGSWSICVVSDGAGSAPLSRVGSNVACQSALGDLMGTLGEIEALSDDVNADLPRVKTALVEAARAALRAIRDEATNRNQPVNAFAATLLILVRRAVGDAQLCAAIQVGDGAIALNCASGLKLLGAADHGQHSSETRFLTTQGMEDDFANRVKFSLPQDLRATLVVSDGVSDDYFPEDKRLSEVFEAVMPLAKATNDAGAALLNWLGYEKKGSSDDRTLVLSWPVQINAVDALEVPNSRTRKFRFRTRKFRFRTRKFRFRTRKFRFRTRKFRFRTRKFRFRTRKFRFRTRKFRFRTRKFRFRTRKFRFRTRKFRDCVGFARSHGRDNCLALDDGVARWQLTPNRRRLTTGVFLNTRPKSSARAA